MSTSYDFAKYLAQVPTYRRKDDTTLQNRATTSANLIFDPQRAETERQRQWQEAQHINNMQKLKASQAGVEEALAYNEAQQKKANAIRAAASGAIGSSGLNDYLNNETDKAMQGQRLNIAATLAANRDAEINEYSVLDRQLLDKLSEIEKLRGQTSGALLQDLIAAEDARETDWQKNALQVALGIGSGELQAADLNFRERNAREQAELQRYIADLGYKEAMLPYNNMTKYQQATEDRLTKEMMGGIPGENPETLVGLRDYANKKGVNVDWDASTGNVIIGNKTVTPETLISMGAVLDANDNRWKLSQSQAAMLLK
jgi:hypothetical protein